MIVNKYAATQCIQSRFDPELTLAMVNRKKSVNSRLSTYPLRSLALARPPPVKLSGSNTRNEKTDILTMHLRARRWKRRNMSASNPTRFIIYIERGLE